MVEDESVINVATIFMRNDVYSRPHFRDTKGKSHHYRRLSIPTTKKAPPIVPCVIPTLVETQLEFHVDLIF